MNFYGIRELSNNTKSVLSSVAKGNKAIITDNGKPTAILLNINEDNFETVLNCVQQMEAQTALSALELYSGSVWISNYAGQVLLSYGSTLSTSQNIGQDSRFSQAFAQNRQYGTYSYQEDGTDYLISYYNAVESGWKYLSCVPEDIVLSGSGGARAFSLLALLCGALGISLGSLILYRYVVRPISALMSHLSDMEQGTLAQAPVPVQRDEISLLFHRYNQMIQRLQKLIDEIYVQQLLRKQAELSFLQSQMDEHFLYNTLNTIYSQASHEHADTSARMILTLSRYFRISLSQGSDKLPLDQLADLLRSYLMEVLGGAASLPPRRGRPAKPFYNFPVLSSTAPAAAAPVHPAPGTPLPFAGGHNFRELGGYEADEGKHVKWGQIYRGITTACLTSAADRKLLDSLGLRLILDLRSGTEAAAAPDYVPDGARLVQICGLCLEDGKEVDFSPEDRFTLLKGMPDEGNRMARAMYERMLHGNKAYKELFRALEAGETPVLFHCSGGKDRTGVAAMLILLALGASDEIICADFVQSNTCRKEEIEALWAEHAEEIAARPEQKYFYLGISGVHPDDGPFVLQTIREQYGTTDAYLEAEYGLTPARLMRLRRMYLE